MNNLNFYVTLILSRLGLVATIIGMGLLTFKTTMKKQWISKNLKSEKADLASHGPRMNR